MCFRSLLLVLIWCFSLWAHAEVAKTQPPRIYITQDPIVWLYNPPRKAAFSSYNGSKDAKDGEKYRAVRNQAIEYGNASWNELSRTNKAAYIFGLYEKILALHQQPNNPAYRLSARILVCKTYKESSFLPQMGNHRSNAVGLTQIVPDTLNDIFTSPRLEFRSKLPGYEHIDNGPDLQKAMVSDPVLQMEAGIAVMELKRRYGKHSGDKVRPILESYLGSSEPNNKAYADSIFNCAKCAEDNNNSFPAKCLCQAIPDDGGCANEP
jgi:hypothetical protein